MEDGYRRPKGGLSRALADARLPRGARGKDDLTPAQLRADAWLVRDLRRRFPSIEYLIGHHEYLRFQGHALWREKDPAYRTVKTDPGDGFMRRLRAAVKDLGLKGPHQGRTVDSNPP